MLKLKIIATFAAMGALSMCSLDAFLDHRGLYWIWLIGAALFVPIIGMIEASKAFKTKLAIPGLFIGAGLLIEIGIFSRGQGLEAEVAIAIAIIIVAASIVAGMIKEEKRQPVPSDVS